MKASTASSAATSTARACASQVVGEPAVGYLDSADRADGRTVLEHVDGACHPGCADRAVVALAERVVPSLAPA